MLSIITRLRVTATATATDTATVIGHRMGVHQVGRCRVEIARLTKVQGVAAGTPLMDARPVTRYRVETAHPTDMEGDANLLASES
jgi:hypothetical protein